MHSKNQSTSLAERTLYVNKKARMLRFVQKKSIKRSYEIDFESVHSLQFESILLYT